jgi:hypothetical protein
MVRLWSDCQYEAPGRGMSLTGFTLVFTETIVPWRHWRMNMVIVASLSIARTITTSSESDVSATGSSCISELW